MTGHMIAALAMLFAPSAVDVAWQDDGSVQIDITFDAKNPRNPFPQGEELLLTEAKAACGDKGAPSVLGETVVTGISMGGGKPQISMSGTYRCG